MREIRIPCKDRLRKMSERFGWVDQRFVTDGHMRKLSVPSLGLYLFLVAVGNHQGISWYGDERICQETGLSQTDLESARRELVDRDLLGFVAPFYQILRLQRQIREAVVPQVRSAATATPEEVRAIFQEARRQLRGGTGSC